MDKDWTEKPKLELIKDPAFTSRLNDVKKETCLKNYNSPQYMTLRFQKDIAIIEKRYERKGTLWCVHITAGY